MLYLVAISLIVVMWFVILAVDIGLMAAENGQAQLAADAAAAAAIQFLSNESNALSTAEDYAALNYPNAGNDLRVELVRGFWNDTTKQFSAGSVDGEINAVEVTVTRVATPLLFARVMGHTERDIAATSVAVDRPTIDPRSGMVSGNRIFVQHDVVQDNFVVYGRNDVRYPSNVTFLNDSRVGALQTTRIRGGRSIADFRFAGRLEPVLANNAAMIIDQLVNEVELPDQIQHVEYFPVETTLPDELEPGTAYVFQNTLEITGEYDTTDVIIASLDSVFLRAGTRINNTASGPDGIAIGIFAVDEVILFDDVLVDGVEVVGGYAVRILHGASPFIGTVQAGHLAAVGTGVVLRGSDLAESISIPGFSGASAIVR